MYYLGLIFILINPLLMISIAIKFFIKCPKQTHRIAFHSPYAHHSNALWKYSHKVASHVWIRLGLFLFEASLLLFLLLLSEQSKESMIILITLGIILSQLLLSHISISLIEKHLKKEISYA